MPRTANDAATAVGSVHMGSPKRRTVQRKGNVDGVREFSAMSVSAQGHSNSRTGSKLAVAGRSRSKTPSKPRRARSVKRDATSTQVPKKYDISKSVTRESLKLHKSDNTESLKRILIWLGIAMLIALLLRFLSDRFTQISPGAPIEERISELQQAIDLLSVKYRLEDWQRVSIAQALKGECRTHEMGTQHQAPSTGTASVLLGVNTTRSNSRSTLGLEISTTLAQCMQASTMHVMITSGKGAAAAVESAKHRWLNALRSGQRTLLSLQFNEATGLQHCKQLERAMDEGVSRDADGTVVNITQKGGAVLLWGPWGDRGASDSDVKSSARKACGRLALIARMHRSISAWEY